VKRKALACLYSLRPVRWLVDTLRLDKITTPGREIHVVFNTRLLPILFGLVLIADLTTPYRGWRVLLVGLGGAWLISYLWVRSLVQYLTLVRERRFGWAQVGDRLVERFTLTNDGWAPALWAEVLDASTLPDYKISRGVGVAAQDAIRWHTEAVCTRRGLYTLGPTHVRTGDPFGIYAVSIRYPSSTPLLVLPPIVPLPEIEVAPGGHTGEGRPIPHTLDRTVSASAVREYMPGDSRRWIHWRTSARRNELFVRLFDGTPSGDWWVLLDVDRRVQVGLGENATEEHGVILAASLADRGLRSQRSVGIVAHGEQLAWLPPREGEGQRWEILRALAMLSVGSYPLADLLERVRPALGRRASLIIITPSLDGTWVEALMPLVQRGAVPTVLLLDPISFGSVESPAGIQALLTDLGIAHYLITRDVLDRPEARPGKQGHWEWRVLGTGKAIPRHKPTDTEWKPLF